MQQVLGYSALETGLAQLPLAGVLILAAGVVSPVVTRVGPKPVTLAGLVVFAAGLAWFSRMPADADFVADLLGRRLSSASAWRRRSSRAPSARSTASRRASRAWRAD